MGAGPDIPLRESCYISIPDQSINCCNTISNVLLIFGFHDLH